MINFSLFCPKNMGGRQLRLLALRQCSAVIHSPVPYCMVNIFTKYTSSLGILKGAILAPFTFRSVPSPLPLILNLFVSLVVFLRVKSRVLGLRLGVNRTPPSSWQRMPSSVLLAHFALASLPKKIESIMTEWGISQIRSNNSNNNSSTNNFPKFLGFCHPSKTVHPDFAILPSRTHPGVAQSNTSDGPRVSSKSPLAFTFCIPYFDRPILRPTHHP